MTDKSVSFPEERKHDRKEDQKGGSFLRNNLRNYGMLLSLFAIMLFFQVMTDGTLMQPLNLTNLVLQNSYIVIMALGMLLVIVTGHIDLSVGSVAGFIGAVAAVLMVRYHIDFPLAVIACLIVGAAIGAAQGYWVAFFGIPSFIVTLAGMLVFKGLALALLQGQSGLMHWRDNLAALLLFAGAVIGALLAGHLRWQRPTVRRSLRCAAGGFIMGCGAALVPGGNDTLLLWAIPGLTVNGALAFAVMLAVIAAGFALAARRPGSATAEPTPAK